MLIQLDSRERQLIPLCGDLNEIYNFSIITGNLPLGDIIICDDNGTELILIERKSLSDLASSIKDGRYAEQSFRLDAYNLHNHNIIYLIEGNFNTFNARNARMDKGTLHSAMFTLSYYKGFSVMGSFNIVETAEIILRMTDKLKRENNKRNAYYSINAELATNETCQENKKYCNVVKKVKKDNITIHNIGEIMLCQIPNVSSTSATVIMNEYKSIDNLIRSLRENESCLNNFTYVTSGGKKRRITKTCVDNIVRYLLHREENVINIAT